MHHFNLIGGALSAHCITLYILVEHFIWVQLRTVRRQEKEPDVILMLDQICLYLTTPMHRMSVYDQENLAFELLAQTLHKVDSVIRTFYCMLKAKESIMTGTIILSS